MSVILTDITLCAIVKNEITNRAGGVKSFVNSILPFVQEAVIVDTGSDDGTRECLEELTEEYPTLKVYDRPFDDFASSRNYSLKHVRTKRVLILDADERLLEEDFEQILYDIDDICRSAGDIDGYLFSGVLDHLPNGTEEKRMFPFLLRLFNLYKEVHFRNRWNTKSGEGLWCGDVAYTKSKKIGYISTKIKHYSSPKNYNTPDGIPIRL